MRSFLDREIGPIRAFKITSQAAASSVSDFSTVALLTRCSQCGYVERSATTAKTRSADALHVIVKDCCTIKGLSVYSQMVKAFSVPLNTNYDVFTLGASSGFLWANEGFCLAGLGEVEKVAYAECAELPAQSKYFEKVEIVDEIDEFGVGPVAFGAFPFSVKEKSHFFVPSIVLCRQPSGKQWLTVLSEMSKDAALNNATRVLQEAAKASTIAAEESFTQQGVFREVPANDAAVWKEQIVAQAVKEIKSSNLNKVVLARDVLLERDHDFHIPSIMQRLRSVFPTAYLFAVEGFVGASPELLVQREGVAVSAHPLAGTAARAENKVQDLQVKEALLASTKNQWEHSITIEWLLDTLLPFCSFVDAEPEPSIVDLANVYHLGTKVLGQLSVPSASIIDLVVALHPTPAVGGEPQELALEMIERLETIERSSYAGPVGWFDAAGNGSFAVGIRSAQIKGKRAQLFAGVGVVEGSDPEHEFEETKSKFKAMLSAL